VQIQGGEGEGRSMFSALLGIHAFLLERKRKGVEVLTCFRIVGRGFREVRMER